MRIAKRVLLSVLWAFGFAIGSAVFIGVALGLYVALNRATTLRPTELYTTLGYIHMAAGSIGLILGVTGILPGTNPTKHDDAKDNHTA